jgi:hypothetical protein
MLSARIHILLTLQSTAALRDIGSTGAYSLTCYNSNWKSGLSWFERTSQSRRGRWKGHPKPAP